MTAKKKRATFWELKRKSEFSAMPQAIAMTSASPARIQAETPSLKALYEFLRRPLPAIDDRGSAEGPNLPLQKV